ncbi:MAG: Carotenogenesis protein CarS [bacterium]
MKAKPWNKVGRSLPMSTGDTSIGITKDVFGAPFRIGQRVRVVSIVDETGDERFLEGEGIVVYLEYECGCGQTFPEDPMIGVRFLNVTEEFWKEELALP